MRSKPSVLMFIDWYAPGFRAGGPIRSCLNMVSQMSEAVNFHIVTSDRDYMESSPYPDVSINEWVQGDHGEMVIYLSPDEQDRKSMEAKIKELNYDIVYINGIFSPTFSIAPLRLFSSRKDIRLIIASRGMLRPTALAIKPFKKRTYLSLARMSGLFKHAEWHATDEAEATDIQNALGVNMSRIHLASNMPMRLAKQEYQTGKTKEKDQLKMIYAGRIAPEKNLAMLLKALIKLFSTESSVLLQLDMYGTVYDKAYWEECQKHIAQLSDKMQLNYVGSCPPNSLHEAMSTADLLVLPTRGENFGHVVIESMMQGTPVLITSHTPWQNLEREMSGLMADTVEDFSRGISRFAKMDNDEYAQWRKGAYARARAYCNSEAVKKDHNALFLADV